MATTTLASGFKEIRAGNAASQKKKQRFPHAEKTSSSMEISWNDLDSDDDEPQSIEPDGPHQPPRIAEWRSNLVALSQRDNLYFVAYQDKIHVTIPQGLKQTIQGKPDLILDLPRSNESIKVGGYINRIHGHCVNRLIVGNLGTLEILLVACDDGDIIAYYTHIIGANTRSEPGSQRGIKPYFHENVGISAWGLAVHEKSRLIAVSSNNREVVVFGPGCNSASTKPTGSPYEDYVWDLFSEQSQQIESKEPLFPEVTLPDPNLRWNSFRKTLKLGPEGHNIPSIDFSNDSNGEAYSVLATDIVGNLWILDIWGQGEIKRIPSMQTQTNRGNAVMGWGALVIPLQAFTHTATPEEAAGLPSRVLAVGNSSPGDEMPSRFFDITETIRKVDDSSVFHPMFGFGLGGPGTTVALSTPPTTIGLGAFTTSEPISSSSRDISLLDPYPCPPIRKQSDGYFEKFVNEQEPAETANKSKLASAMRTSPSFDDVRRRSDMAMLPNIYYEPEPEPEVEPFVQPLVYRLPDRCAILRTYQDDIELIPPVETMPKTICRRVLRQSLPVAIGNQSHFERLIFQVLIVELGLVIVGSQIGRVALLSLTRPEDSFSNNGPITMFRIDKILPTKTHEIRGMRPSVPLLGIAVSPLQGDQMRERRRWRLIMHYYDHSILTYELSREEKELLVF